MADDAVRQKVRKNPFQQIILKALKELPNTRDDDLLLFATVLLRMHHDPTTQKLIDTLIAIKTGDLPSFDTVTRLRRNLQERHPEIRGKRYYDRHLRAEVKVAEEREERVTLLT